MPTTLAIDQGTTGTKTVLLNSSGDLLLVSNTQHQQIHPQPGWVEHDPVELLQNVKQGIRTACLLADETIAAVGIDNQGETVVAWDAVTGDPVYNAIVWQDNRTITEISQLKAAGAEKLTLERAGLPLDPYFSASKLRWILEHVENAQKLLRAGRLRIGTTDSYFLERLTGSYVTDVSTASRTSLMNLESENWDEDLCDLFQIPVDVLPDICSTCHTFGDMEEFGLPVRVSIVDQQASLFGHGCVNKGATKITFGTGAFALANTGHEIIRQPDRGILPTLAWKLDREATTYAVDAGLYNAGSAINWLLKTSLAGSLDCINQFDGESAAERGLMFVPALSGLGFPYWDRTASAIWLGMSLDTTREDLCRAVVEGVALLAGQMIDELDQVVSIPATLPIDGGLTNNPYFCQFFADVIQREVLIPSNAEITAYGTAKLAMLSCQHGEGSTDSFTNPTAVPKASFFPKRRMDEEILRFSQAVERCQEWKQG